MTTIRFTWPNDIMIHPNFVNHCLNHRARDFVQSFRDEAVQLRMLAATCPHLTGKQLLDIVDNKYVFKWEEIDNKYVLKFVSTEGGEEE